MITLNATVRRMPRHMVVLMYGPVAVWATMGFGALIGLSVYFPTIVNYIATGIILLCGLLIIPLLLWAVLYSRHAKKSGYVETREQVQLKVKKNRIYVVESNGKERSTMITHDGENDQVIIGYGFVDGILIEGAECARFNEFYSENVQWGK